MTAKKLYDWQTAGGVDDVSKLITLTGKILAWSDKSWRQSERAKDFTDIVRLVKAHPELWGRLNSELQSQIDRP